MNVIPAINCLERDEVSRKLRQIKTFLPSGGWVHLDVSDAHFTFRRSWGDPKEWPEIVKRSPLQDFFLEVHLIVEEPEQVTEAWLQAGAKRLIVHLEAVENAAFILTKCEEAAASAMLALNPETSAERLHPYLGVWHAFQILAVNPGFSGQKFLPVVLPKIKFLRQEMPRATIEVDGGINLETAIAVKAAGADTVVSNSYIFDSPDPVLAFHELQGI